MAATVVFNQSNIALASAPPDYFVPNSNGTVMPNGFIRWLLEIETAGLPAGQLLAFIGLDYRRPAWQDAAGVNHPANEWIENISTDLQTGPQGKSGGTVAFMGAVIGSRDSDGNLLYAYPNRFRFHVTQCPGYASVANIKLTMFDTV